MQKNEIEQSVPTSVPTHLTHETLALLREKYITDDLIEIIHLLSEQVAFLHEKLAAASEQKNELLAAENATLQRENEALLLRLDKAQLAVTLLTHLLSNDTNSKHLNSEPS